MLKLIVAVGEVMDKSQITGSDFSHFYLDFQGYEAWVVG